jgi:hypothetical protein
VLPRMGYSATHGSVRRATKVSVGRGSKFALDTTLESI